jgi:hypothetical protein
MKLFFTFDIKDEDFVPPDTEVGHHGLVLPHLQIPVSESGSIWIFFGMWIQMDFFLGECDSIWIQKLYYA